MKNKLIRLSTTRLEQEVSNYSPLKYLKSLPLLEVLDIVISTTYLYTRPKKGLKKQAILLTEVICAIGHSVRGSYKLKKDSALAAKTGAFFLYNFEQLGMIQVALGGGGNGHGQYVIQVTDDESIAKLWETVTTNKLQKLPSETPYAPWVSTRHETGAMLVKTNDKGVLFTLRPETHPIIFTCVNTAQEVGWTINKKIFDLHSWALRNKTPAFAEIWELANPEAKTTKLREVKAIGDIAKRFLTKTFYHLYYFDFRGRKYPTTAYLHEQGSDLARGLLLRADKKVIGQQGFFWLMVSIASNWAGSSGRDDGAKTDKIPLRDRYLWALDNEEIMLSYAESPKVNQGWMQADKPWQFLAACFELFAFRSWQAEKGDFDDFNYSSSLECYIDGSNNGSQHLSALTRDEITAPHVNLVPLDLPGDLYKYVGDHVWEQLAATVSTYPKHQVDACNLYIDTITELKKKIAATEPASDARQLAVDDLRKYKETYIELGNVVSPVFWMRIKDQKHKRKVVKR